MSDEKKPGLSAEPGGSEPKTAVSDYAGPQVNESKINESRIRVPSVRGFPPKLDSVIIRDILKLFGWIASILIIGGLCWTLTKPARSRFLIRTVNRVLEQSGDYRRITEPSSPIGDASLIGSWYTMTRARQPGNLALDSFPEGTKAFIFSFVSEGTFFPCAAVVDPMGKVQEFIALNAYGKKILARISPGILKLYIRRIEGSES
jgi:hypothetical protein